MTANRPGRRITRRLRPAVWIALACTLIGGCAARNSQLIVLPDSEQVFWIEPNEPFTAPWPAAVLSRGRYLELVDAEMELISRGLR